LCCCRIQLDVGYGFSFLLNSCLFLHANTALLMYYILTIILVFNYSIVNGNITILPTKNVDKKKCQSDTAELISTFKQVRKKYNSEKNLSLQDSLILEDAYKRSVELKFISGQVQYFDIYGVYERNRSDYSKSLEYHNKALQLIEKHDISREKAIVLNNIGVVYRRLDALDRATQFHLDALLIAEKLNDRASICVSLNSLGNIYLSLTQYDKALEYCT